MRDDVKYVTYTLEPYDIKQGSFKVILSFEYDDGTTEDVGCKIFQSKAEAMSFVEMVKYHKFSNFS